MKRRVILSIIPRPTFGVSAKLQRAERRAREAEDRACTAERKVKSFEKLVTDLSLEKRIHLFISREWIESTYEHERHEYPLRAYRISPALIRDIENYRDVVSFGAFGRVCAAIATGTPKALSQLVQELASVESADESLVTADLWECRIDEMLLLYRTDCAGTTDFLRIEDHTRRSR